MDIHSLIDIVRHLDKHLDALTTQYGTTVYAILFAIVFAETGLVVLPLLPGDSLLFAVGAVSAREGSSLSVGLAMLILSAAAILGDTLNYQVGKMVGPRVMAGESSRWFNKKHLAKTHEFFEKHGGKAIILARFVPIVRTFAPFVAGAGAMSYSKFIAFNIGGGIAWVVSMTMLGYFVGNIPVIQKNFELAVIAIVILSVLPAVFEYVKARRAGTGAKAA